MDPSKYKREIALSTENSDSFLNLAFDGCSYYFLLAYECKILQYNLKFEQIGCAKTRREYNCFCYDFEEECFWAATNKSFNRIFKLDKCFREIDNFCICLPKGAGGVVTGLSFDCCSDSILVTCAGVVLRLDKETAIVTILYRSNSVWVSGVASLCPGYAVTVIKDGAQSLMVFDKQNQIISEEAVPLRFMLKNIIINPCVDNFGRITLYALAKKKGCYPYILEYLLSCRELGFNICKCNDRICKKCCDKDKGGCKNDDCCCKNDDCCCKNEISQGDAAAVLESIALVETSIAHILNAEGEKLQKIIACSDNVCEILAVNESVRKTIAKATHLENALYDKMETLNELCCCMEPCCDEPCCNKL